MHMCVCHSCEFACHERVVKTWLSPWLSPFRGWDKLTMVFPGKSGYIWPTILGIMV